VDSLLVVVWNNHMAPVATATAATTTPTTLDRIATLLAACLPPRRIMGSFRSRNNTSFECGRVASKSSASRYDPGRFTQENFS
jgi:hypothetical protein